MTIPEIQIELEVMARTLLIIKGDVRKLSKHPESLVDVLPVLSQLDTAKTILMTLARELS